jgi:hypothetical protein
MLTKSQARLIGFERAALAVNGPEDFVVNASDYTVAAEGLISPEHMSALPVSHPAGHPAASEEMLDLRQNQIWILGCILFELLHGYSPWEHPESAEVYPPDEWGEVHRLSD